MSHAHAHAHVHVHRVRAICHRAELTPLSVCVDIELGHEWAVVLRRACSCECVDEAEVPISRGDAAGAATLTG
eukprot:1278584-Prymnesium_polylepis.1